MRGEMEMSSSFSKMTYKGVQYVPLSEARAEIEQLRDALRKIASHQMKAWGDEFQEGINSQAEIARAALERDEK